MKGFSKANEHLQIVAGSHCNPKNVASVPYMKYMFSSGQMRDHLFLKVVHCEAGHIGCQFSIHRNSFNLAEKQPLN